MAQHNISWDSELLTNYISAELVSDQGSFAAFADGDGNPVFLRLTDPGSDGQGVRLQLIKKINSTGPWAIFDFASLVPGLSGRQVQAFELKQDTSYNTYVALAVLNGAGSQLFVLKPFRLAHDTVLQGAGAISLATFSPLSVPHAVDTIRMTPVTSSNVFPSLYLVYRINAGQLTQNSDIVRVVVDTSKSTQQCTLLNDTSIPENAFKVIDLVTCTNKFGTGIYVLYTIQGTTKIVMITRAPNPNAGPNQWYSYDSLVSCPNGATSLTTYIGPDGQSALAVSGQDGLWQYTPKQASHPNQTPTLISTEALVKNATQLETVQSNDQVAIWVASGAQELGYATFGKSSPVQCRTSTVLDAGSANNFSPVMTVYGSDTAPTLWHTVVARSGNDGHMTVARQSSATGIWSSESLAVARAYRNVEKQSHTVTIHIRDALNNPVPMSRVSISASTAVDLIVNNRYVTLSTDDTVFSADATGDLGFIIPTDSLGSATLRISGFTDNDNKQISLNGTVNLRPSDKVFANLKANVPSKDALKNAKGTSGKSVWTDTSGLSDDDWTAAYKAIQELQNAHQQLPRDGSTVLTNGSGGSQAGSSSSSNWDKVTKWFRDTARRFETFVVEKFGAAWKFTCKIAGKAFEFVIDTIEKVSEVLHMVLSKLSALFENMIDWLGFIFNWGDMIQTQKTAASFMNGALDWAATKVGDAAAKGDRMIDALKSKVGGKLASQGTKVAGNQDNDQDPQRRDASNSRDNTRVHWTKYQLMHGGSTSPDTDATPSSKEAQKAWDTIVSSLRSVEDDLKATGSQISNDFRQLNNTADVGSMLQHFGQNILVTFLDVIKAVLDSGVAIAQLLIAELKKLVNYKISIPIFSSLFHDITGEDLTIINAAALIAAIPATILTKAVLGSKPPTFQDPEALIGQIYEEDPSLNDRVKSDFADFMTGMDLGIALIKVPLDAVSALVGGENDESGEGVSWSSFLIGLFQGLYGLITTVSSLTSDKSLPAGDVRAWITGVAAVQTLADAIMTNNPLLINDKNIDKKKAVLDLGFNLTIFALMEDVYVEEVRSTTQQWADKDDDASGLGVSNNALNTIAGIGNFTQIIGAGDDVVEAVGAAVETVAAAGMQIVGILLWKHQYQKKKTTRFAPLAI